MRQAYQREIRAKADPSRFSHWPACRLVNRRLIDELIAVRSEPLHLALTPIEHTYRDAPISPAIRADLYFRAHDARVAERKGRRVAARRSRRIRGLRVLPCDFARARMQYIAYITSNRAL